MELIDADDESANNDDRLLTNGNISRMSKLFTDGPQAASNRRLGHYHGDNGHL